MNIHPPPDGGKISSANGKQSENVTVVWAHTFKLLERVERGDIVLKITQSEKKRDLQCGGGCFS